MREPWPEARIEAAPQHIAIEVDGAQLAVYLAGLAIGAGGFDFPIVAGAALGPIVVYIASTLRRGFRRGLDG